MDSHPPLGNSLLSFEERYLPFLILLLSLLVYGLYGFDGQLSRDDGVYLYAGQRMADGVPPYVSVFFNQTPLGPMLVGAAVMLARGWGWDEIYTVRFLFYILGCLAVVAVYFLGRHLFTSPRVGALAALVFLGFEGFGRRVALGPETKVVMILLVILTLFFSSQRRWFLAGVCGSLAFLTWQPTAIYGLVAIILILALPRDKIFSALSQALLGLALPLAIVAGYFMSKGALAELVVRSLLLNSYLEQRESSPGEGLGQPLSSIFANYQSMLPVIFIGFLMFGYFYYWRRSQAGSLRYALTKDSFAPLLLSFPAPLLWSLRDYQGTSDFYIFLPYVVLGFAYFLEAVLRHQGIPRQVLSITMGITLFLFAAAQGSLHQDRTGLAEQRQAAGEIVHRYGEEVKILSLGAPQVLVLLSRENQNRYLFIIRGTDQLIEATTPGGFRGWLESLEAYSPEVIAYGRTWGAHIPLLTVWLEENYHRERIGPWRLWVRKNLEGSASYSVPRSGWLLSGG